MQPKTRDAELSLSLFTQEAAWALVSPDLMDRSCARGWSTEKLP